jgi:hypothetical protein
MGMLFPQPFGNQFFDRLTEQFFPSVAKPFLGSGVDPVDAAVLIGDHNCIGR